MSTIQKPSHLGIYYDVAMLFLKYAPKRTVRQAFAQTDGPFGSDLPTDVEPSSDAEEFARDLEKRGPAFVKLGQLLSTRADLFPPEWLAALARLQDDVELFPIEAAREIIEEELGVRISKAFSSFDETPIAGASIGQVYRACLRRDGIEVAVKVQRPGIRREMVEALACFTEIAGFLEAHSEFAKRYRFTTIVSQFRKHVMSEMDYTKEAQNLLRLGENLRDFPRLVVPQPIDDYSGHRVLTMEWIPGTRITDLSGVVRTEIDMSGLADELFRAYLRQVLVDGFFHADPHPGNILLTADHRIALLDLGMVGYTSDRLRDQLLALLAAISERRGEDAAATAIRAGNASEEFDHSRFTAAIIELVQAQASLSAAEMQIGSTVLEVTDICGRHGLRMPDELYMLGKMLLNLDGVGIALDPTFNPYESIRRNAADIAQRRLRDSLTSGNLLGLATELKELAITAPRRVNGILSHLADNELRLRIDAIDEETLTKGFQKVANRIATGLILAAIIVGASLMMRVNAGFTLFGYPGLAMLFFLAAATGGLILVIGSISSDRADRM